MSEQTTTASTIRVCSVCSAVVGNDQSVYVYSAVYCPDCAARYTTVCSRCGTRIRYSGNAGTDSFPLCQDCYDDYYTNCDRCGVLLHRDEAYYDNDDNPYCSDCYHRRYRGSIEDYYYKPEPIFYGSGDRYFGVELEVDEAGEDSGNADEIANIANGNEVRVYCKHDESLDDGFEIVSHPMTLDYHEHEMPWPDMLERLRKMGYLSHLASTCGLHVHVNRISLGDTMEEQDTTIARVLFFFEKFWNELLKFSRRTSRQLDKWAALYGYNDHPKEMLEHVKKGTSLGHYYCVNLQNESTIEFRIFRGTLRYNTFIATIQLVNRICDIAEMLTDEEMRSLAWTTFVEHCTKPELVHYLKERRLYVNDHVEALEEA